MKASEVIQRTTEFVRESLSSSGAGHDWWHTDRVRRTAVAIGSRECADLFIVELTALLHDIADWKFNDGDETAGSRVAATWLLQLGVNESIVAIVSDTIESLPFRGARVRSPRLSLEGQVVQDADRLDAIGAIGIARAFSYGGFAGQPNYDPGVSPRMHQTFDEYKLHRSTTINHFYEKLLLLKDQMHTRAAREIAVERHQFLEQFLSEFFKEWNAFSGQTLSEST